MSAALLAAIKKLNDAVGVSSVVRKKNPAKRAKKTVSERRKNIKARGLVTTYYVVDADTLEIKSKSNEKSEAMAKANYAHSLGKNYIVTTKISGNKGVVRKKNPIAKKYLVVAGAPFSNVEQAKEYAQRFANKYGVVLHVHTA
jgi:hypothetical protein